MGYRGKLAEQERAREMRATGMTLLEIARELEVSKSSVSLWVRDVEFTPRPRQRTVVKRRHPQHLAKLAEIEAMDAEGRRRIGTLSEKAFLAAGIALYAGEGSKGEYEVNFANTDPRMIAFHCAWLRRFFAIDETRLRCRVYLHEGLDIERAHEFWSTVTKIPRCRFQTPYRAPADPTLRTTKHEFGCAYVRYCCVHTHRRIMGLMRALLSSEAIPG